MVQQIFVAFSILFQIALGQTTYNYKSGGSDWTGTCSTGQNQSPIDISNIQGTCDNSMTIDVSLYNQNVQTSVVKDQSGLSSAGDFGSLYAKDINGILIGYEATQLQVHIPSEHTVDGSGYDVELQIYFTIKKEFQASLASQTPAVLNNAVVSVFYQIDPSLSSNFFNVWSPSSIGTNFSLNPATAFNGTIDSTNQYYSYQGSLTQPTCDETVNWYIFPQSNPISQIQYNDIKKYIQGDLTFAGGHGNNRNLQSVNGRTIKLGNVQCEEQFIYFFSFFILYIFINYFIFKLL
ncbi:hypothetical protein ABPG74_007564 [Tetrahymena malaccensis]